jgi:predicted anti-sigma-YlaC factor YlaD
MNCEDIQKLMMGYLDKEISDEEKRLVEKHLSKCRKCRAEFDSFTQLKEVTDKVKLADLKEDIWAGYWKGVYRRIERGAGWFFLSIGAIILAAFGVFQFFKSLFEDPTVSIIVKFGVGVLAFGIIVLLVSIIRERVFAYKHERYKEIER